MRTVFPVDFAIGLLRGLRCPSGNSTKFRCEVPERGVRGA
jgi:hypothetical protein